PSRKARRVPSGLRLFGGSGGGGSAHGTMGCPVVASQERTSNPLSRETTRRPSELKQTLWTLAVCPLRVRSSCPVAASHTFTVWSALALARHLPSGLKTTLVTC